MKKTEDLCVVYCNTDSEQNAKEISNTLVREKLAACVSIFTNVIAVFEWENEIHNRPEFTMMIKTRNENLNSLEKRILELHPDSVPEIISLPITNVHEAYGDWILSTTRRE